MGKKKGKKSGSGKKKKGGKKGGGEPVMTWREALLAYQINIKERQLEDVKYELSALEEKNLRSHERNERLNQEQEFYLKNLLKQAKEFEKTLSEEKDVNKVEVTSVMMNKWEAAKVEEKDIALLKEQIAKKEAEIMLEEKQVEYWNEYKDRGQFEHQKQIKLMQQELVDMETSFKEMSGHLERTLDQAKDEILTHTEDTLDKQKYLATEKAMARLDKNSRQEVLDNDWLKREAELHKRESEDLLEDVARIERANLSIMSELFECTVDDLKISRNFYLTQFGDDENLDETGVLEMDLGKMTLPSNVGEPSKATKEYDDRPRSILDIIEAKVMSLDVGLPIETDERLDSDETDESDYDGDNAEQEEDPFNIFFQSDQDDFGDFLQLGPLELKLLNITGTKMPIYTMKNPTVEEAKAENFQPSDWPVTHPMLKSATTLCGK